MPSFKRKKSPSQVACSSPAQKRVGKDVARVKTVKKIVKTSSLVSDVISY